VTLVRLTIGLLGLAVMAACARRPPAAYAKSRAAAERAYAAGRYEEAAANWLEAAEHARTDRNAAEARYRAAASWQRAGNNAAAARLYGSLASDPASDRSSRAAFEAARLRREAGDVAAGNALIDDAIRKYPDSGVARRALERRLIELSEAEGHQAALAYLDRVEPDLNETALAESVVYQRARYQQRAGSLRAARDSYLTVARRFPYPFGAYWDDALYHAAELERELGRPSAAIEHLEKMLSKREPKPSHGSLERPRFGPARFLIAEIYRDDLGQPNDARQTFLVLVDEHPTSPLRDDALWEAALLAHTAGDSDAACAGLRRLVSEMPDSRYVPCAPAVCSELPTTKRRCRSYIAERIPDVER
jgi:TolA-binding protein